MENIIIAKLDDLFIGITSVLENIPVEVSVEGNKVLVKFQDLLICGTEVKKETYRIFNVTEDWKNKTTYLCEKAEDGTWFYYLETIDECIGEIKRLVLFEAQKNIAKPSLRFADQVKKYELDIPANWKIDNRPTIIKMLQPLIDGTDYYFRINTTDTKGRIVELYRRGQDKRIMGFSPKSNMEIGAFFNHDFYVEIKNKIGLPENSKPNKTQEHVKFKIEKLWNILCAATNKTDLYV